MTAGGVVHGHDLIRIGRALATRFLDVVEHDIVPLTRAGVERGDKVFGGAILSNFINLSPCACSVRRIQTLHGLDAF